MREGNEAWLREVEEVLSPVFMARGLTLVDMDWSRQGRRWVLRLFLDKPGGVTVADCQAVSREAGDVLDVSRLIEPAYDLEVSSPGLDRELSSERELAWGVGKDVRCWLREPVNGQREVAGRLAAVSATQLTVHEPEGGAVQVPRALVSKTRLEPSWSSRPRRK